MLNTVQTTIVYQHSAPAAGLLRYVGLYNHGNQNGEKGPDIFFNYTCMYVFFCCFPRFLDISLAEYIKISSNP